MSNSNRHLPDGLYEKIINQEVKNTIDKAKPYAWIKDDEKLDPQEAVHYLSSYLKTLVSRCLKDVADATDEHELEAEIKLTNILIKTLAAHHQALGDKQEIVESGNLLTAVESKTGNDKLPSRSWERPDTSLSRCFLFTNSQKDVNIAAEINKEISSADRIDLLVSFIKFSGLTLIYPALKRFTEDGGQLRIITTTYMGATDPKAVNELAKLKNTQIRISYNTASARLHAKAYMFYRDSGYSTAYIGSSNLSHTAISAGLEWNMKVTAQELPGIMDKIKASFDTYWHSDEFELFTTENADRLQQEIDRIRHPDNSERVHYAFDIRPYAYQQAILDALQADRINRNQWKNLIVAATGTGKTAIAAFDYKNFAQSRKTVTRLLFVAHREEILRQSLDCFRQVLRDPDFGELKTGRHQALRFDHLFISIQSLNSSQMIQHFAPDFYDMIIVDEFHHAAAASYQELLSYFKPKILLGLTATPERMDGKSILKYFDQHISAQIRLADAVNQRLLCPFRYFGSEDPVDLSGISWKQGQYDTSELTGLYAENQISAYKRAKAICQAIERYTADIREIKGLGFCVSKKHAAFMADFMNTYGIKSKALDADSPRELRDHVKQHLEQGELHFIFTVDLFNEGVDIPCINTVLFLRPTNSLTIFIQQLGRGLRLSPGKDVLTVLDFVAQANRHYDFAGRFLALLGRSDLNLKQEIESGFAHAPKGCAIQLDKISQERILENIRQRIRTLDDLYKEQIQQLYQIAHQVPTLNEFLNRTGTEAADFYKGGKRSYARLCAQAKVIPDFPKSEAEDRLVKILPRMLSIDSPRWINFLKHSLGRKTRTDDQISRQYTRMWQFTLYGKDADKCGLAYDDCLSQWQQHPELRQELNQVLDYLDDKVALTYPETNLPYPCALQIHARYSRDQIFAALNVQNPTAIREGVKYLPDLRTDVFLVTLNKSTKEFSQTTLYEDYAINSKLFHWQSQSTTSESSRTGQRYIHQNEDKTTVLLFVREKKQDINGNTMPYTFLGPARYQEHHGSYPMSIIYNLDYPIPAKYLEMTKAG